MKSEHWEGKEKLHLPDNSLLQAYCKKDVQMPGEAGPYEKSDVLAYLQEKECLLQKKEVNN